MTSPDILTIRAIQLNLQYLLVFIMISKQLPVFVLVGKLIGEDGGSYKPIFAYLYVGHYYMSGTEELQIFVGERNYLVRYLTKRGPMQASTYYTSTITILVRWRVALETTVQTIVWSRLRLQSPHSSICVRQEPLFICCFSAAWSFKDMTRMAWMKRSRLGLNVTSFESSDTYRHVSRTPTLHKKSWRLC